MKSKFVLRYLPPQSEIVFRFSGSLSQKRIECGAMPNLMVALPNIGDALCSTPQSLAESHY